MSFGNFVTMTAVAVRINDSRPNRHRNDAARASPYPIMLILRLCERQICPYYNNVPQYRPPVRLRLYARSGSGGGRFACWARERRASSPFPPERTPMENLELVSLARVCDGGGEIATTRGGVLSLFTSELCARPWIYMSVTYGEGCYCGTASSVILASAFGGSLSKFNIVITTLRIHLRIHTPH